jgi:glycerol-3-phosphate cytidylyltransferase-like family protein
MYFCKVFIHRKEKHKVFTLCVSKNTSHKKTFITYKKFLERDIFYTKEKNQFLKEYEEISPQKKTALCFGTFHHIHAGHHHYIALSSLFAENLHIIISRDSTVKITKPGREIQKEDTRLKKAQEAFPFATVSLGNTKNPFASLEKLKPNYICLGYDHTPSFLEIQKLCPKSDILLLPSFFPNIFASSLLSSVNRS